MIGRRAILIGSLAVLGGIASGAALVAAYRHFGPRQTDVSISVTSAELACIEPTRDFGDVENPEFHHRFELQNVSMKDVIISRIGKSCSCFDVTLDRKRLKPGATARLEVSGHINPAKPGAITNF